MVDDAYSETTMEEHQNGPYLGTFEGLVIRGALSDTGRPVLEIHGDDNMAAIEATEEAVDGLTEAAAEINMALDRRDMEDDHVE